jgi:signal transduction histidine kinase
MLYDVGLLCTLGLGLWVLFDVVARTPRQFQALPTALLGASSALWASGELLIGHSAVPEEVFRGRCILYLGSAVLPVAWLWAAADAARARWLDRAPWLLLLLALPQAVFYALLYTDAHAWFVHATAHPPVFGPLFWAHAVLGWSLITVGTGYFMVAAIRLGKASPLRMLGIVLGTTLPLLANLVYLTTSRFEAHSDPTPILLAVGILAIRMAAIDSGLTAFLPVARKDVIEQLRSGVLVANLEGRVVDANPAAAWILREANLAGSSIEEWLARARANRNRVIEVDRFAVKSLFGVVGSCAVLNDRTDARRLEQQLLQAQKLEAIGYLTAGIAHEINNPLAFLNSNLRGLEEITEAIADESLEGLLDSKLADQVAEAPEMIDEMKDGLARIARMVKTLMGFARAGSSEREFILVDLHAVASKASALASAGVAANAIRTILHPVPPVLGCEEELVQVTTNLLLNAIQASASTPEIEVEVSMRLGQVVLAVRDRGSGIPEDHLPRIFDPFFTTKSEGEGTGLGLSLSFDLARLHGGTLQAANRPEGGAEFTLWLAPAPGSEEFGAGI